MEDWLTSVEKGMRTVRRTQAPLAEDTTRPMQSVRHVLSGSVCLASWQALYDQSRAAVLAYPPHGEQAINRATWMWSFPAQVPPT